MAWKNQERRKKYQREWNSKNKDKVYARVKRYKERHPERVKAFLERYKKTPQYIYNFLKENSKRRSQPILLSRQEFVDWYNKQDKKCFYCGVLEKKMPEVVRRSYWKNRKLSKRLTIDRMDNKKGYAVDNIVLACPRCNGVKSDFFTVNEMKKIGKEIIQQKWKKEL